MTLKERSQIKTNVTNGFFDHDDTKLYSSIKSEDDQKILQEDITHIHEWSLKWDLKFHPEKCKVMRIGGEENILHNYEMNGNYLKYTDEECDLGLIIDNNLNFEAHMNAKVNKANKIMGLIRRTFTFLNGETFTKLFKSLVRPHLEYANAVWDARLKASKNNIENVQRRATKYIPCCKGLNYNERLEKLNLPCLAYRKLRGDMVEAFKFVSDHYDEEIENPIKSSLQGVNRTRGHKYKMSKSITAKSKTIRRRFYFNRITNFWNDLPEETVTAPSIASFERRLDKYWNKFKIKFNFERCVKFEEQMLAGIGSMNLTMDT